MPIKRKKPAKKAAKKKSSAGSGLAKYRTAIKKATAVTTRQINDLEKRIVKLKKIKATKAKAAAKKYKK